MAGVVQETLETVLRLAGVPQYVSGMRRVAQATQAAAQAQAAQAQATQAQAGALAVPGGGGGGGGGLAGLAQASLAIAAAAAALKVLHDVVAAGVNAYGDYDREVIRTEQFLHNMGQNLPTSEFTQFARTLSITFGESQTEIVRTMGYLARFGSTGPEIERATKILLDASKGTGIGMEEMARGIEMARRGHARELFGELGIPIRAVEGQMYSLNQILDIVQRHTEGMAAGFVNTLPGAMDRAAAAVEDLKIQFGRLISPVVIVWLNQFANLVNWIATGIMHLSDALGILPGQARGAAAAASGLGGGTNRTEDYLRRIEFNTGPQGALGHAVRGGGAFGEPGGGLRIRDFNRMFAHGI